jgi:P-type Mg2+ transporter
MNDAAKHAINDRRGIPNKHVAPSRLLELSECPPEEALKRLETARTGLSEGQVAVRQERYGLNEVTHEKPPTWYRQLFHAFITPFNGVLFAVSIVSLFSDVIFAAPDDRSFKTIVVLTAMVLLSTLLRFWQESFGRRHGARRRTAVDRERGGPTRGSGRLQVFAVRRARLYRWRRE